MKHIHWERLHLRALCCCCCWHCCCRYSSCCCCRKPLIMHVCIASQNATPTFWMCDLCVASVQPGNGVQTESAECQLISSCLPFKLPEVYFGNIHKWQYSRVLKKRSLNQAECQMTGSCFPFKLSEYFFDSIQWIFSTSDYTQIILDKDCNWHCPQITQSSWVAVGRMLLALQIDLF